MSQFVVPLLQKIHNNNSKLWNVIDVSQCNDEIYNPRPFKLLELQGQRHSTGEDFDVSIFSIFVILGVFDVFQVQGSLIGDLAGLYNFLASWRPLKRGPRDLRRWWQWTWNWDSVYIHKLRSTELGCCRSIRSLWTSSTRRARCNSVHPTRPGQCRSGKTWCQ